MRPLPLLVAVASALGLFAAGTPPQPRTTPPAAVEAPPLRLAAAAAEQPLQDPCADIADLHAGTGAPDRQDWFNHLNYQDYARYWIACVHHWGYAEWDCLVRLNNHESGWEPTRWNRGGSGAYGIPQALPGDKMGRDGADWRTNGRTQIRWQTRYIADRYGAPSGTGCHGPY